ncbi:PREDICTED: pectinesterase inhibitor-like [Erythranthe guttata]|uniref:pectinesterase inhibitor-like n=1 Tax=Erythranthe guttata TaxID=4155 RepID=UPI00064D9DE5|nr:PREDICTED: pectinesterase inhibitor-like [Erythranthe guttata]|eukprot:XP_012851092.1 PREDICTED: pectinesterase inhibitor-like [Erythranthe guttata]
MELPFASMFILKIFLLCLLSITTNSKPTNNNNNKLISDICPKTKNPTLCFDILSLDKKTRLASSLHTLGLGSLGIAIPQANMSVSLFSRAYNKRYISVNEKEKYKGCLGNYTMAGRKLGEAKKGWIVYNYALARKNIKDAHKVPISCQRELVGAPSPIARQRVNEMPDIAFDIPFVIVNELEGGSKFDQGFLHA